MTTEQNDMVTAILELEEGLNDWEIEFIENMDQRRETLDLLSAKQVAKLTQIYDRKVLGKEIDGFQTDFPGSEGSPDWWGGEGYGDEY